MGEGGTGEEEGSTNYDNEGSVLTMATKMLLTNRKSRRSRRRAGKRGDGQEAEQRMF